MGKKIRELILKEPLIEKEERCFEAGQLSEEELYVLEREISGRITEWLEWYLGKNPQKYEAFSECMKKKHI